ncbi:MAG: hypothetical protein NC191_03490 [Muribaculaceae bacterium]|nr:hypothetical protein [Muribaculaceae bacterium]
MDKIRNGDLITSPADKRKYKGFLETKINDIKNLKEGKPTGFAAQNEQKHVFTPQEIGKMTPEEFKLHETEIMEQLSNGQIKNESPRVDYENYKNDGTSNKRIFTREDIDGMTTDEYTKNEKEIVLQMNSIGIPYKNEVPKNVKTYEKGKSYSTDSKDGRWVTINGNHVFIEK